MADVDLRELERRFRASGLLEDEAAWLRARVQAGDLEQSRLELAAYCGHEVARLVSTPSAPPVDLEDWVRGLGRWGAAPCQLACLQSARLCLPLWETHVAADMRPGEALALAEDLHVGIGSRDQVQAAAEAAYGAAETYYDAWQPEPAPGVGDAGMAACYAAQAAAAEELQEVLSYATSAILDADCALIAPTLERQAGRDIRSEIEPVIGAWALGLHDPVRERVEARQREAAGEQ